MYCALHRMWQIAKALRHRRAAQRPTHTYWYVNFLGSANGVISLPLPKTPTLPSRVSGTLKMLSLGFPDKKPHLLFVLALLLWNFCQEDCFLCASSSTLSARCAF